MLNAKYLLLLIFFLINCSTTLINKKDYDTSLESFSKSKPQEALQNFPSGESGSFITTMEKTYLSLLSGKPDIDDLNKYSKMVDERVRFSVSREVKNFFYVETKEGYYASEHEIIWMHLLLSWGYSLRQDYDKARTEAKIASNLLSGEFSAEGRFDDPLMRILLAYIWVLAGEWESAKVDFRKAYELNKNLKWCITLSEQESMPEEMYLIMGGVGFEPYWDPRGEINPIRGARGLAFKGFGNKSIMYGELYNGESIELNLSPDSKYWYERHYIRDNEIYDLVKDSIYGQKFIASAIKGTIVSTGGILSGIGIGALGIGAGGGLIYLGVECNCGELTNALIASGLAVAYYGIKIGYEFANESIEYAREDLKDTLDISDDYRFVRFLPEYVWTGKKTTNQDVSNSNALYASKKFTLTSTKIGKFKNVSILQYADIK